MRVYQKSPLSKHLVRYYGAITAGVKETTENASASGGLANSFTDGDRAVWFWRPVWPMFGTFFGDLETSAMGAYGAQVSCEDAEGTIF